MNGISHQEPLPGQVGGPGRAFLLLLMCIAAGVLLVLGLLLRDRQVSAPAADPLAHSSYPDLLPTQPIEPTGTVPPDGSESRREEAAIRDERGFLSGVLDLAPQAARPVSWRLVVLTGDGDPVIDEERSGEERRFALELAPGRYGVRAEARGLTSIPEEVEIRPGAEARVTLTLVPPGVLAGSVADPSGNPVVGLPVVLLRSKVAKTRTSTDALGRFALPPVIEGEYTLVLGDPAGAIIPPLAVQVRGSRSELELLTVPELGSVEVQVVDETGEPAPGARVNGTGDHGGSVEAESDSQGRATGEFLPAGMYRLFAAHPTQGRGNRVFELQPGEKARVEIRLLHGRPQR